MTPTIAPSYLTEPPALWAAFREAAITPGGRNAIAHVAERLRVPDAMPIVSSTAGDASAAGPLQRVRPVWAT